MLKFIISLILQIKNIKIHRICMNVILMYILIFIGIFVGGKIKCNHRKIK